jgi:hypothetical protein
MTTADMHHNTLYCKILSRHLYINAIFLLINGRKVLSTILGDYVPHPCNNTIVAVNPKTVPQTIDDFDWNFGNFEDSAGFNHISVPQIAD